MSTSLTLLRYNEVFLSRITLILALIIGLFLRIWKINAMGFNSDEAVYAGQAASIAGVPILKDIFPVFRAHPLLFQLLLSIAYKIHFSDLLGRLFAVMVGMCTIFVTYQLGKTLYGRIPGALAALFLAIMPYHVIVSRQVLLDGAMVFFATLTLFLLAQFGKNQKNEWLFAASVAFGLAILSKETSIIMLGAIYIFLALSPEIHVRIKSLIVSALLLGLVLAPFPLTLMLAGGSTSGRNYLTWQLLRRPNHDWIFYLQTVPPAIGISVILIAILGIVIMWKARSWREKLLISWILVPVIFFQIWPVKGFQYLLAIAPPLALLAGRLLGMLITSSPNSKFFRKRNGQSLVPAFSWIIIGLVVFSLGIASWQRIQPEISSVFLAGSGGVPGGREAGTWVLENVPESATFMTLGPSMANIIQFYGERKAYGLSVSQNPLHRNPSYESIDNPDAQIRHANMQYLVWDSFSAARSTFYSDKLLGYVNKYNGRAIHTESITVKDEEGNLVTQPIIIIYEVHP